MGHPVGRQQLDPPASSGRSSDPDAGREVLVDPVGDEELRVLRPAVAALDEAALLGPERLAVGGRRVLLVWGAVADVAVQDDQRGTPLRLPEHGQGVLDALPVVGVAHAKNVPPVREEPSRDVLREGEARVALDRDVVVVVDPAKVVEAEVAGQRRGFAPDALHQATVADDDIDVVVEDGESRLVVALAEPLPGDGHPDARRGALAERARGRLDARNPVVLGVTGSLAPDLAEATDILERHRRLA